MLDQLVRNRILANGAFVLILLLGAWSYSQLSREQEPSVNFNWITIVTTLPDASPSDIEERVTKHLEDAVAKVSDVRYASSSSRQGVSTITVRFENISDEVYDERVADLRREIQNKLPELPPATRSPEIYESSSSNLLPTAIVLVTGKDSDESLRKQAKIVEQDIERFSEVDYVDTSGEQDPELQVLFKPEKLVGFGISPVDLADTVEAYFRDVSAGSVRFGDQSWQLRIKGTSVDPKYLESLAILTAKGEVPLRSVADAVYGRGEPTEMVLSQGRPAVMLEVFKKDEANLLELVERLKQYIVARNELAATTGVSLSLLDDRTEAINTALNVMENNALIGFVLILAATWLFLGARVAFVTSIGLPFILCGVFFLLFVFGFTLNVVVLLGLIISLGMLVDDSVVVAESIVNQRQAGLRTSVAVVAGVKEVASPVTASVLTTTAAFLPLAFMPGVLGDYMRVIPVVVVSALLISLLEAFWILPVHISSQGASVRRFSNANRQRVRVKGRIRRSYVSQLVRVMRKPRRLAVFSVASLTAMVAAIALGAVKVDFFAGETTSFFYINIDMPPGTGLSKTLEVARLAEERMKQELRPEELRASAAYSGIQFSDAEPYMGDRHGQVFVSIDSGGKSARSAEEIIEALRPGITSLPGPQSVSFLVRRTGPPTEKPINLKIRGDDFAQTRAAADKVKQLLSDVPGVSDIADDDIEGGTSIELRLNNDAITRSAVRPEVVIETMQLLARGKVVASILQRGERVFVRVKAQRRDLRDFDALMSATVSTTDGGEIPLSYLVDHEIRPSKSNIRHFDFRRAITVTANLDTSVNDVVTVNQEVARYWDSIDAEFPNVNLTFSTILDDIDESIQALAFLFLVGLGLIYLILGTQFQSYVKPLVVLSTVPLALIGVLIGIIVSDAPFSLYTLYAVVALAGIAVNAAIMMLTTANRYRSSGFGVTSATVYAARRRVIPIIITSVTTIAGLLSLAAGGAGRSEMWTPVANAIVWGLGFSTLLSLFFVPVLIHVVLSREERQALHGAPAGLQRLAESIRVWLSASGLAPSRIIGRGSPSHSDNDSASDVLRQGIRALRKGELEAAIRLCETAAKQQPGSKQANLSAAEALVAFQRKHGWDVGYFARAQRYLSRAEAIDPRDYRLELLHDQLAELQPSSGE